MKKNIAIIGGGAAGLMLAGRIDTSRYRVVVYEKNKTPGLKFLLAGKGGFNLTHGEDIEQMIQRYYPVGFLRDCLLRFDNNDLREWLSELGIETYIGSSNRVFPARGIKPAEVLNAFLQRMARNGVEVKTEYIWKGFHPEEGLLFVHHGREEVVTSDDYIFALGGASRAKTGSAGDWLSYFEGKNVPVLPFQASNCASMVDWEKELLQKIEGRPLKNISLSCGDERIKGELVITRFGIEGTPVYAHSRCVRNQLSQHESAMIYIDLKPTLSVGKIIEKINQQKGAKSRTKQLQNSLKLSPAQMAIIVHFTTKEIFLDNTSIAKAIKNLPIPVTGISSIEEAISTVGGIALEAVDEHFQLKALPNHYVIGEMLDWDAPTGGYLLQGCFSMGAFCAEWM